MPRVSSCFFLPYFPNYHLYNCESLYLLSRNVSWDWVPIAVAHLITQYLSLFQSEKPLIHCTFDTLKAIELTILVHFLKPDLLKGMSMASMCMIDLKKENNYLALWSIDTGQVISSKEKQGLFHPPKSHHILQALSKTRADWKSLILVSDIFSLSEFYIIWFGCIYL